MFDPCAQQRARHSIDPHRFRTSVRVFARWLRHQQCRRKAFNNESIRTVAACREALAEARYEAEQREQETSDDGAESLTKVMNVGACGLW